MSHLEKEVTHELFIVCETLAGKEMFPADLVGVWEPFAEVFLGTDEPTDPVDGDMLDRMEPFLSTSNVVSVECVRGWFARLSAPGYLDCTDWSGPFDSEEEALEFLEEMYGDE